MNRKSTLATLAILSTTLSSLLLPGVGQAQDVVPSVSFAGDRQDSSRKSHQVMFSILKLAQLIERKAFFFELGKLKVDSLLSRVGPDKTRSIIQLAAMLDEAFLNFEYLPHEKDGLVRIQKLMEILNYSAREGRSSAWLAGKLEDLYDFERNLRVGQ